MVKSLLDDTAEWIERGAVAYELYVQVDKQYVSLARVERDGSNRWSVTLGNLRASGISTSEGAAKIDAITAVRSILIRVNDLLRGHGSPSG